MKSRTNSSWTLSTYTFEAPVFFALARTGASSSPWPRSATKAITSQPYVSISHRRMTEVSSPPEYARTTFFTFSTSSSSCRSMLDEFLQDGHLQVQPVLGLVEHGRPGPLDDLVGNLLPPVGGKAVHHDRLLAGHPEEVSVDAVLPERREAFPLLLFLSHARPYVGVQDVRPPGRLDRVPKHPHVPLPGRFRLPADLRGRLVPLWTGDAESEPQEMGGFHPGVRHVVAVPHKGDPHLVQLEAPLLGGHQVGENLARMVIVRQPVDHGNGSRGGHLLGDGMGICPDHDPVGVPGQNACGVPDGLPPPDLRVRRGEKKGVPPQSCHPDLERRACPRGCLLEHHRQRLARQGARSAPLSPSPLPGPSGRDEGQDVAPGQIEKAQEILVHFLPSCGRDLSSRESPRPISPSLTVNGGRNRNTFSPAVPTTSPAARHRITVSFISISISIPIMSPVPRISTTSGRSRNASRPGKRRCAPFPTGSRRPRRGSRSPGTAGTPVPGSPGDEPSRRTPPGSAPRGTRRRYRSRPSRGRQSPRRGPSGTRGASARIPGGTS